MTVYVTQWLGGDNAPGNEMRVGIIGKGKGQLGRAMMGGVERNGIDTIGQYNVTLTRSASTSAVFASSSSSLFSLQNCPVHCQVPYYTAVLRPPRLPFSLIIAFCDASDIVYSSQFAYLMKTL